MALSDELRCLVCQNQTLADSHADLAIDLRNQVRDKLAAGMSEREVIDFMVARYGDFVLYKPPLHARTWLLWFGPFLLLGIGLTTALMLVRRKGRADNASEVLPEAERLRAQALLDDAASEERQ